MREGLHLGRRPSRSRALAPLALLLLLGVAALELVLYVKAREAAVELGAEIAALRGSSSSGTPGSSGDLAPLVPRLRAVVASGTLEAFPLTRILELVESHLPEGVTVSALSIQASPPGPGIAIDAVARSAADVTELERRISSSPLVASTSVLEERRMRDGALAVRLQVELEGATQ